MGLFGKIKNALKKTREAVSYKVNKLFTGGVFDDEFYDELEAALLTADVGAECAAAVLDELRDAVDSKRLRDGESVRDELRGIVSDILSENEAEEFSYPLVIMIAGVNGVGKTTTIGKLARNLREAGKSVLIAAGDTFRAAASDQLRTWADRAGVKIVSQGEGGDPAAVVYDAIKSAVSKGTDALIIDTAGRLHNKAGLMEELKKISRVVEREYPEADYRRFIVLDAVTGQNALSQVELFNEAVDLNGIILTKLDGTAKGGVMLPLCREFGIPIVYVGTGEGIDDLQPFNPSEAAAGLI